MQNKELAKELNKPILRKFEKPKVHSSPIDNVWVVDLVEMQLLNKFDKGIPSLLCVIDIYSKYVWVIPLKDKKGIIVTNAFQDISDELIPKPNKIWVDKGSEFHNRSIKSW